MLKVGGKVPFVIHHIQQSCKTEIYFLLLYVEQRLLFYQEYCHRCLWNVMTLYATYMSWKAPADH